MIIDQLLSQLVVEYPVKLVYRHYILTVQRRPEPLELNESIVDWLQDARPITEGYNGLFTAHHRFGLEGDSV